MSGEDEDDPLDDIFVDGDKKDRELIASIINPYLQIDTDGGELYPNEGFGELDSKDKILITLAAEQAKEVRGIVDTAALGPSEISDLSGVKENTVKPGVRDLADEGLIADTNDGYEIRGPQLQRMADRLAAEDN